MRTMRPPLLCALRRVQTAPASVWTVRVGLEIHAQIKSKSKAFSSAPTTFNAAVNSQLAPFDIALPGALPVLNARCVEAGVMTALALGARINSPSYFDRKHYFYYDMPAGYQITQQRVPLAENGSVPLDYTHNAKMVSIQRLHLEHDSGKSLHTAPDMSLVDLNRCGTGLMEIVTRPDMSSGAEAALFVRQLIEILTSLDVSDGKLAEGSLRVDANVSVHKQGFDGPRCEIKNINGLRFLSKAIDYEAERHISEIEQGKTLTSETRNYNVQQGITVSMRTKEKDVDYRFMPEPDIPPLHVSAAQVDELRRSLPVLPRERVRQLEQLGVSLEDAVSIVQTPGAALFLDTCMSLESENVSTLVSVLRNFAFASINEQGADFASLGVTPLQTVELARLMATRKVSSSTAKEIWQELLGSTAGGSPLEIATAKGKLQSEDNTIDFVAAVREVANNNQKQFKKYASGRQGVLGFFVGQILRQHSGLDPKIVNSQVKTALDQLVGPGATDVDND